MQAWSVRATYDSVSAAMEAVARIAVRPALEFMHVNGRLAQAQFLEKTTVNDYVTNIKALMERVPYKVGFQKGEENPVAWINGMVAKCGMKPEYEFVTIGLGPSECSLWLLLLASLSLSLQ